MAVAFDANLGSLGFNAGNATSRSLTTIANGAPGCKIVAGIMLYNSAATVSAPTSGGLTWRVVRNYQGANFTMAIVEADAPAGWVSGTAIVFPTTSSGGGAMWAMSFTGVATGAAVATNVSTAGANWSAGSLTTTADALLIGYSATLANGAAGNVYLTPTGGATEVHDFGDGGGPLAVGTEYRAVTGAGSYSITGTALIGTSFNQQIGCAFLAAASGTTVTLTPATETDTAVGLSLRFVKTLAPATETDAAVAAVARKSVTLISAGETDAAQGLTISKVASLTPAAETSSAVALIAQKIAAPSPATETDAAIAPIARKFATLLPATETDTAIALNVGAGTSVNLTPAAETDTAVAVTWSSVRVLAPAVETNTAVPAGWFKLVTLTPALEADQVPSLALTYFKTLVPASETDTAPGLVYGPPVTGPGVLLAEIEPGRATGGHAGTTRAARTGTVRKGGVRLA